MRIIILFLALIAFGCASQKPKQNEQSTVWAQNELFKVGEAKVLPSERGTSYTLYFTHKVKPSDFDASIEGIVTIYEGEMYVSPKLGFDPYSVNVKVSPAFNAWKVIDELIKSCKVCKGESK